MLHEQVVLLTVSILDMPIVPTNTALEVHAVGHGFYRVIARYGFMQPPESVADAVVFLCSATSDYMTGATLLVDGGCSLYPMD